MGMPTQPDKTGDVSLLALLDPSYHLVNRLDRPVSGIVMIAKSPAQHAVMAQWTVTKKYVAITRQIDLENDELVHFMGRDHKRHKALIANEMRKDWKEARLSYRRLLRLDRFDVLEVTLKSGKFHQIRAQLAAVGATIRGDLKYGFDRSNKGGGIDLHAYSIDIPSEGVHITAPILREDRLWQVVKEALSTKTE